MSAAQAIAAVRADGAELVLKDGHLCATPAGKVKPSTVALVREHAPELKDLLTWCSAAVHIGTLRQCFRCTHYGASTTGSSPDFGKCKHHGEVHAYAPLLRCDEYEARDVPWVN